jgi:hypothetical protein
MTFDAYGHLFSDGETDKADNGDPASPFDGLIAAGIATNQVETAENHQQIEVVNL